MYRAQKDGNGFTLRLQDDKHNRVMYRHITQGLTLVCEGCIWLKRK